jgi:hypothetical protein
MSKESVFDIGDLSEIIKQASSPGGLRDDRVRQIACIVFFAIPAPMLPLSAYELCRADAVRLQGNTLLDTTTAR